MYYLMYEWLSHILGHVCLLGSILEGMVDGRNNGGRPWLKYIN